MWQKLIFDYCKSIGTYSISFNELYESPICCNAKINRRLKMESIKSIAKWLVGKKFADYTT